MTLETETSKATYLTIKTKLLIYLLLEKNVTGLSELRSPDARYLQSLFQLPIGIKNRQQKAESYSASPNANNGERTIRVNLSSFINPLRNNMHHLRNTFSKRQ